ncbi:LysE family translocator [Kordiimonas sp. SCSIO 12610]|uniref:LysE family translocator n=1 Tax=Kordiimonas sp. SCSIO 12610 TaxID=2829597 RepID=UPI002108B56C|nr:LysE family transporter [Kordiimonas sp. SCSIO 12610]UTW56450.1 LysE family transporter [Kordiimonas sp. SCSIO 12610]
MADIVGYSLWGILFGILVSAPVGPVNIICLKRSLSGKALEATIIGFGAAIADTFYAGLAAFGLGAVHKLFMAYEVWFIGFGAVIMAAFAFHTWRSDPHIDQTHSSTQSSKGMKSSLMASFSLTIANPGVFIGFLGLFSLAGLGDFTAGTTARYLEGGMLCLGVIIGSMIWWAFLGLVGSHFSSKISDATLVKINRVFAIIIGFFALSALTRAIF